jgi:hypothetical protein
MRDTERDIKTVIIVSAFQHGPGEVDVHRAGAAKMEYEVVSVSTLNCDHCNFGSRRRFRCRFKAKIHNCSQVHENLYRVRVIVYI